MKKFGVLVEVVGEAENETQFSHKVSEALKAFDSFAISEGPDEIEEEEVTEAEDDV